MSEEDKKDDAETALVDVRDSATVLPEENDIAKRHVQEGEVPTDHPWHGPPTGATGPWGWTGAWTSHSFTSTYGPTGPQGQLGVGGATGPQGVTERPTIPDAPDETDYFFDDGETDLDD